MRSAPLWTSAVIARLNDAARAYTDSGSHAMPIASNFLLIKGIRCRKRLFGEITETIPWTCCNFSLTETFFFTLSILRFVYATPVTQALAGMWTREAEGFAAPVRRWKYVEDFPVSLGRFFPGVFIDPEKTMNRVKALMLYF
jgi:hypothetical protein